VTPLPVLLATLLTAASVQVGLERLEADGGRPLRGKRVGLVVHAASVTVDGRHAIDVLRDQGVDVLRLFAPEHGLRSRRAAGGIVSGGVDAETGLPVISLYGDKTRPSLEDLEGLDALVFDLQGAGVRFYTYVSTLILALEAAAEAGVEFVVLDRPNPIGGEGVAGPQSDPRDLVPKSLVNTAPGPLVHGLTTGEMARYVNSRREAPARLTIVPLKGWERRMTWVDTGRPWVPPSPNLRTPEAAMAYPGVCLIEATTVSEGRGTESPFLLLGAPWLNARELARRISVPGFAFEPARFTPRPSGSAPHPKHAGLDCAGLRIGVVDPRRARPYELGVRLLHALRGLHRELRWTRPGALDWLVGTQRLRIALERGDGVEAILAADRPAIEAFEQDRREALLY
jgi:uncharacterized protein YbbC (DUF1343 family)